MPIGDPRDWFFYPTLTLVMDSYILDQHILYQILIKPDDNKDNFVYSLDNITCHFVFFFIFSPAVMAWCQDEITPSEKT